MSFLGTGSFESKEKRTYKQADYHLGEKDLGCYPFLSAALKKHYNVDTMLLIGTVHSMWEEVYRWFAEDSHIPVDEAIYFRIAEECEKANSNSALLLTDKLAIEKVLGIDSKVILVKYGIDETEVIDNINIILGLQEFLKNNDELIIDITHAFRSLPIFMMNLLLYLRIVCKKKVFIPHIHYGMFEVIPEFGFVPIIDLKAIVEVNDWITGAFSFSEFGNAYKISQLVYSQDKSCSKLLDEFSDLMNLNHLSGIQSLAQRLSSIKNKEFNTLLPTLTITPIVNDFINSFGVRNEKPSLFQLKVARWQLKHRKYAQAFLTTNEAMITYVCEQNGLQWDDYYCREQAKNVLGSHFANGPLKCEHRLREVYKKLKPLRNCTAHFLETDKNVDRMKGVLDFSVKILETIIK